MPATHRMRAAPAFVLVALVSLFSLARVNADTAPGRSLPKPGELQVSEVKKFLALSAGLIKKGQQAGAQLSEEMMKEAPLTESKLSQSMHAFQRAADAVARRHLALKHSLELKAGDGRHAASNPAVTQQLHWGRNYLRKEYGHARIPMHMYGSSCNHLFPSLCHHGEDAATIDDWWKAHGISQTTSDLEHAAQYDEKQEEVFHQAVRELHSKIVDHRLDLVQSRQNRTVDLHDRAEDYRLKDLKKKLFQQEESDDTVSDLRKSSAAINSGLVHEIGTNADMAYGSYDAVESEAAREEMQEMADWHELLQSMKRSGKVDPLYVKQVEKQGAAMMNMVRNTMLRLHNEVKKEHKEAKTDHQQETRFEQEEHKHQQEASKREQAYLARQAQERKKAAAQAEHLLKRHSKELQGEATKKAAESNDQLAVNEDARAKEQMAAKARAEARTQSEEARLTKARRESREHEKQLIKHEEQEAKAIRTQGLKRLHQLEQEHATKTGADKKAAIHAQAQAKAAKSQISQEKLNKMHQFLSKFGDAHNKHATRAGSAEPAAAAHVAEPAGKSHGKIPTAQIVGIPPKFAAHDGSKFESKPSQTKTKLVEGAKTPTGEQEVSKAPQAKQDAGTPNAARAVYKHAAKEKAFWGKLAAMLSSDHSVAPASTLRTLARQSLTAAKMRGVALAQV